MKWHKIPGLAINSTLPHTNHYFTYLLLHHPPLLPDTAACFLLHTSLEQCQRGVLAHRNQPDMHFFY